MDNTETSVIFRIEKSLKTAFERVAKDKDLTVSQMLRAYIRLEIEEHGKAHSQKDLFKTEPTKKQTNKKTSKKPISPAAKIMGMAKKGVF